MKKYQIITIIAIAIGILYFSFGDNRNSIENSSLIIRDTIPEVKQDQFKSHLFEPWKEVNGVKDVYKDFLSANALQSNQYELDTLFESHIVTLRRNDEPRELIQKLKNYENLEALQLVEVRLIKEDLNTLIQILSNKTHFKKLLISHSGLQELPEELFSITTLETLDLSYNKINTVSNKITDLINLKYLSFYSNKKLSALPQDLGVLEKLEFLDIARTSIEQIPLSIGNCKKLKSLIGNASKIDSIPSELYQCRKLEYINLGYNKIQVIPAGIEKLKELQSINLSGNEISIVPETIANLDRIWILSLSKNRLTEFPMMILKMPNLVNLSLNGNVINDIPKELANHKMLRGLTINETESNKEDLEFIRNKNSRINIMTHY